MLNRSDYILIISDFPSLPSPLHLSTIITNPCSHLKAEEKGKGKKREKRGTHGIILEVREAWEHP